MVVKNVDNNVCALTVYAKNLDKEFSFTQEKILIGRNVNCDIVISADGDGKRVSMRHASFRYQDGAWHIQDENSLYGTRLNGEALKPKTLYAISPGDNVVLANAETLEIRQEVKQEKKKTLDAENANVQDLQKVLNETYPGLTMYVRDVDMAPELVEKYETGMIIRERGFVDASCRVMGMETTHRYAILSNHMDNLTQEEEGTNFGLFVAGRNSHFKVLGKHSYEGKTVIFLLHLPDNENWKLFENTVIDLDKKLVADCIRRFEAKCLLPPVQDHTCLQWKVRCLFPIGIGEDGRFFPLED